ncbi:MAG: hypothetical protein E7098_04235 [Mediterranea massiliensis]|nr:hypothetical protein [Mediterranea massiliensis]
MEITNNFQPGAIVNNGQMNVGGGTINVYQDGKVVQTSAEDEPLVAALTPIFYGYPDEAARFLDAIKGAKPTQITAMVEQLVKERKISDASCHKPLWQLLHDAGLYPLTLQNWNNQI